jgi:choline-sulfatase
MLRRGNWKLSYSYGTPVELELYDLDEDPGEFTNLADDPRYREIQDGLLARIMELWDDPERLTREVAEGQETRLLIRQVAGDNAPF